MKALGFSLLGLAAILAILAVSDDAGATTTCHATGNWCQTYAHVSTTTGAGASSARCFAVRLTNTAPTCTTSGITPSNEATWELDPSGCLTVYYFDTTTGVLPPATPTAVTLRFRVDDTATAIYSPLSGAVEPANGSSYTFCATSTGQAGGSDRAGTVMAYLNVIKTGGNGLPGNTNYNIDTMGGASVGAICSATCYDRGMIRGKMLVSDVSRSAYPADSTFAYGTAADEQVTITGSFTTPFGENNVETIRTFLTDSSTLTVGEVGATVDVDSGSLAQAYTVDSTYPYANNPWVGGMDIRGNSAVTGLRWSVLSATGHGTNIVRSSDTAAYKSTTMNIDPTIAFDKDGSGTPDELVVVKLGTSSGPLTSVFNKGETIYAEFYALNARGEKLTRTMTLAREDATPTTCFSGSITPSGAGLFSGTATLGTGSTCLAANTDTGSDRYFRLTNTDQNHRSNVIFDVSSKHNPDAHIQLAPTLNPDDYPTQDANEDFLYEIRAVAGVDASDRIYGFCKVENVRHEDVDTSGSTVARSFTDPDTVVRLTGTTDTGSDGWTGVQSLLATTPLGATWTYTCTSSFNGNSGSDVETFEIDVDGAGGGFPGDPMRASCTPNVVYAGGELKCAIALSNIDGSARTGNAAGTLYDIRNPSNSLIVTGGSVTEYGTTGVYYLTWSPGGSPTLGNYVLVGRTTDASPVTAQATFTVATDPFLAVASALSTAATSHGVIEGYTDTLEASASHADAHHHTMEGYVDQVEGYTDTLEASASHADAHHHTIESDMAAYHANETAYLDHINDHLHELDADLQVTRGDILDAIEELGLGFNGSFELSNGTVSAIHDLLLDKLGPQGEPVNIESATLDLWIPLLFWVAAVLFFVFKDWAFSLAFTIPGILETLFPDQIPGEFSQYFLFCLLGVVMQYFVGDRQKFSLHGKKKPTGA